MSNTLPYTLQAVFITVNDLLLHFGRELCKIRREASYSHQKITVRLGMLTRIDQHLAADGIELKLESPHLHKGTDESQHLILGTVLHKLRREI